MKKVFISLFLAIVFCIPCFAGDLQKQFEARNNYNNIDFCKKYVQMIIRNDYETFLTNGDSMYGRAIKLKQKYQANNLTQDVKYIDMVLSKYKTTPQVIDIDDNIYQYLQLDTKDFLAFYNSLARLYNAKIEF